MGRVDEITKITATALPVSGKLRLLYEGFPMAMITENAGGIASAGMCALARLQLGGVKEPTCLRTRLAIPALPLRCRSVRI